MAPIGVKLWENAFQTICNISFFDVRKKIWMKFFRKNKKWRKINKYVFSRSYAGLSMIGRSAVRNHCLRCVYLIDTTLGEGVKEMVCVFDLDLEAKMTVTIRAT